MLQSLGLKKALLSLGYTSKIMQTNFSKPYKIKRPKTLREVYHFPAKCLFHRKFQSAYQKNLAFLNSNFEFAVYKDYDALCGEFSGDGVVLAGSDQIWNPKLPENKLRFYFAAFAGGAKRVSYAASMGLEAIPTEKKALFQNCLGKFSYISVREAAAKKVLEPLTDKEISVHIDPTFLLNLQDWRSYEKPYPVEGDYILLYAIYWDKSLNRALKQLKKKTGLPVIAIKTTPSTAYATRSLYDVGPEEFLWLIDHAAYVVTSSFHGAAFSAIFQKKFSAVINPMVPSRITNLMDTLELPVVDIESLADSDDFDYLRASERIAAERSRAYEYLRKAL